MYAGQHAAQNPERIAFVMASTGEAVTYAELVSRTNRLANLLRAEGLKRLDHYAIFMENTPFSHSAKTGSVSRSLGFNSWMGTVR